MQTINFVEKNNKGEETPAKVIPISLELLEQTQTLLEYDGRLPATQPVKHFDFIKKVQDIVSKEYMMEQEPIWVTSAAAKRIMAFDPEKIGSPASWLFQRLVTRINVTGDQFADDESNMNIAIGFTDKGIQVAFGQNVRICSNQCIFGGKYMATYGPKKMPYEKMLDVISEYTHQLPAIREHDLRILNEFKEIPVSSNQIKELIGDVHMRAIKQAYFNEPNHESPMNVGQVSNLSRNIGQRLPGLFGLSDEPVITSLYELYNDGTQIFKPERSEITTLWEDVNNWGEYVDLFKLSLQ